MKLRNKIAIAITASLITGTAASTSVDFRHEWKADSKEEASRVKLGHGYTINDNWKGNLSLEMKFKSEDPTDTLNNVKLTETELDWGYTYKVNKNWELKPGMPISMTDSKTTFKPQFRVVHNADMGLTTAIRIRYEIANYSDSTEGDTDIKGNIINKPNKTKVTLSGGYKIQSLPDLKLGYEANYWKSHDDIAQFDDQDDNYDYGLKAGYKIGNWQPFGEVWNSSVNNTSDDRQVKLRAGIKYYF